jgi:hypothetical protein
LNVKFAMVTEAAAGVGAAMTGTAAIIAMLKNSAADCRVSVFQ